MTGNTSQYPYLCSDLVSITGRHSKSQPANLEAIGERSALLLTETPYRDGSEITIRYRACTLRGTVQRCRLDAPLGYYVDVSLRADSHWSVAPQHLFDVRRVKRTEMAKSFALENGSGPESFLPANAAQEFATFTQDTGRRRCSHQPSY